MCISFPKKLDCLSLDVHTVPRVQAVGIPCKVRQMGHSISKAMNPGL